MRTQGRRKNGEVGIRGVYSCDSFGIRRMDIDTLVRRIIPEPFSVRVRLSVKSDEHWRLWVATHCGR